MGILIPAITLKYHLSGRAALSLAVLASASLLAGYHKAVISALANVEDALIAVQQTTEQVARQREATEQARRAYRFAQMQMHAGTINILTLLNTETSLFTAEDQLAQAGADLQNSDRNRSSVSATYEIESFSKAKPNFLLSNR